MTPAYNQTTTLNLIRENSPCDDGWRKLLAGLGKTKADDEPLTIAEIYRIIGFDGALWCLRALPDDRLPRHVQAWCAEQVLHIFEAARPNDMRIRDQIAMLRDDTASPEQRDAARAASRAASWAAAWDSRSAAWAAARAASWDAALAAARDARVAAQDAAQDAAHDAQERQFRKMIGVDQ